MLTLKDLQELKDPGPPPEKPADPPPPFVPRFSSDDAGADATEKYRMDVVVWNQWVKHRRCYLMAQAALTRTELGLGEDGYVALLVTLIEHLGLGESGRILSDIGLANNPSGQ